MIPLEIRRKGRKWEREKKHKSNRWASKRKHLIRDKNLCAYTLLMCAGACMVSVASEWGKKVKRDELQVDVKWLFVVNECAISLQRIATHCHMDLKRTVSWRQENCAMDFPCDWIEFIVSKQSDFRKLWLRLRWQTAGNWILFLLWLERRLIRNWAKSFCWWNQ